MTGQQIDHVEKQLISVMDTLVDAVKKRSATPVEIASLPRVAEALAKIHSL